MATFNAKYFADKLNHCLDETGAPMQVRERAVILSRMLDIPKQQAWSMLDGQQMPDHQLLDKIAVEFDVDPTWFATEK